MGRIANEVSGPISNLASSRYMRSRTYVFEGTEKMSFEIYKRVSIPVSPNDRYTVISGKYQYRPDLMSYEIWGFPDYWWVLMSANNIWDVYDFNIGRNIRVPNTIPLKGG